MRKVRFEYSESIKLRGLENISLGLPDGYSGARHRSKTNVGPRPSYL